MSGLGMQEILKHLPHRAPFLLVDRVIEYVPEKYLKAVKNVSFNEPWFAGHFPENPVMPGVLMLEALAQAAGILAYLTMGTVPDGKSIFYLAGFDKAKFKRVVRPGDQLELYVEYKTRKKNIWKIIGKASVAGELACSTELTSAYSEIKT